MLARRLKVLWLLARARSRVVLGSFVALLATVVPVLVDMLPGAQQALAALPLDAGTRVAVQGFLQVAGIAAALYGRVDDAIKRRNAASRLDA